MAAFHFKKIRARNIPAQTPREVQSCPFAGGPPSTRERAYFGNQFDSENLIYRDSFY
jgi:hypothetical protein